MAVVQTARLACMFVMFWLPLSHQQSDDVDRVVPYSTQEWPPASLTFVFDTTGSMNDDLDQVKKGANAIFKAILSQSDLPVQEFIVVPFHDPVVDPSSVTVTRSTYQFKEALDSLYVDGGGDCPEMAITGITLALQVSRPGSFIFVFTDASAKDYHLTDGAISLIQSTRSNVVFVLTGDCGTRSGPEYDAFIRIATASTGEIFQLPKIAVDQVITYIDLSVQARVVNLLYTTGLQPGQNTIHFDVDSCLQNLLVTITATGTVAEIDRPENELRVKLTDPLGNSGYSFEISEKAVKVVKVESPEAGRWSLNITSRLPYAITVSGRSVCDFKVSFTYKQSLGSYYTRPVAGLPVSAVLNPTVPPADEEEHICSCEAATVTHMYLMKLNGTLMTELPVNWEVSKSFDAHINKSVFTAPSHEFLVMITGHDEHGYKFQRTTSTIIPGQPEAPVAIQSQTQTIWALQGEPLELLCRYRSIVSVTIVWYKDGKRLNASENLVFYDDGRLVILNVADSDAGKYHCEIQSSEGNATGFPLNVSIAESPTIISGPDDLSTAPGEDVLFICEVTGSPNPEVEWWIDGSVPRSNPRAEIDIIPGDRVMAFYRISAVTSADQGNITCYAKNIAGETQQTATFEVQVGPTLEVTPKRLVIYEGESVTISCKGNGVPTPTVAWFLGNSQLNSIEEVSVSEKRLSLASVRLEDTGVYTCVASNILGQRREMAHLEVHASPQLLTELKDTSVNETGTVILTCIARGNPPPTIDWLHNGQKIILDNRRQLKNNSQVLVITNVHSGDRGNYTCMAENTIGHDKQSADLHVITPPVIVMVIVTPVAVSVGRCVLLPCEAQGEPSPVITWHKSSGVILTGLSKYEVYPNGTLQICNVTESDSDTYTCVAVNEGGRDTASTLLDVQISPKISLPLSDQWVMIGTTATFRCEAVKGNPKAQIQWLKDQSEVLLNSRTIYISRDKATLEIRRVGSRDDGEYTCIASNSVGFDSSTANLNVIIPPIVRSQMTHITVVEGQTASLHCYASGNPRPTIEWFKGSQAVVYDGIKYVSHQEGTLKILNSQIDDAGQYQCLAKNIGGEDAKNLTVDVQYPPSFVSPPANQEVLIYTSAIFRCVANGNPEPEIQWLKDGVRLTSSDEVYLIGSDMIIPRAQPHHAGMYKCNASNSVGSTSAEATLLVLVPPVIDSTINRIAFIKGFSAFLPCDAYGIPTPRVHWERNGQRLFIDGHKYTFFSNGTLQIKNVQVDDSGIYHCVASNDVDNVTAEITVDVHFFPSVVVEFENESVLVNKCLLLQCIGSGNPAPVIMWRKNTTELLNSSNVYMSPNGTQLTICPVKESDAGIYTCIGTNKLGQSNISVNMDVIVPPYMVPVFNETAFVVGGDAWLPCEATGIPPPKISWFRDSEEIDMLSTKYHIHANGTLQIKNLEQGDSGIYWCMATNEGGQHNHSITLDVHFGPLFNGYPFDFDLDGMVSSTIVLNCSTLSNPAAEVIWYKNDAQIQIASGSRFSVSSDGARLTISDLREGDAGNYTCRVKNYVNGISVSWPLTVVVPSSILKNINRVNALLNLSAWLPCYTYGIPTPRVKWVQDGWQIHDSSKYVTFGNGTLRIDNLQQSDSGVYECHAGNVGGNDTHNILLNVQYGPVLESTLEDKVVLAHSDVIFHCQASGNPLPLITWSRNGQTLNSSIARVRVFGSTLVVRDVRIYDNGSYTCTAKSTFVHLGVPIVRKASSTAKLTVNEPPIITHYEVLVTVSENETSWFDCKASGFPHPNIQWLKNDTEINDIFSNRPPDMESTDHESGFPPPNIPWLNDGQEIVGNGYQIFSNGTLRMDSLSKNDSGLYKCIATNIVGKDNITTRLDVLYPPFITNKFYDQSSIIDIYKSVTFQCIADGNPSPQLEWWFQGHRLNNSVQGISITSDSLTIDGVQSRNAGQYTCVAINLVGEHSRTLGLNIIERESDLIEVKINSDTYLPCVVHGEPSPQLTWWKDGVKLNLSEPRFDKFESGTLHIKGVLREDGGGYQCVVFNFGVSAIKNTTLSVLYPPNIISGPIDQTVFVQSNVTFNCIVDASLPYQITWTKNGRSIENQESLELGPIIDVEQSNVISISPDGSLLTISNIDRNASGWYTCFAQNEIGLTTASGHLNVIVGAVCLFQNNAVEHVRGTTASFPCGAYGLPKPVAVWEKNALSLSGQPRFSSNSDGLLTIRDIRKDDDGMYVCIARNPGGSASCATRMTVLVPPEITIALSDQRILWGLDATFICEAEGNPPPVLSWEKDGAEIVVNGSGSVEISADGNTLTVKHVSVGDAGLYTCNASNKVSHAESTGHLFIIVPPTVRVDEIVTYTEGDIAFMHCRPRGDPTPSVEWIINGNAVQNVDVRYQVLNEGTLKITNVTQSDAGIYECIATNEGGQVNASTTLQVKYKPVIIVPPDNVRVVEGETGSFRCVVQSWPSSNIVWLRERKTLKNATGAIEISSDGTLLSIVNAGLAEEGSYTCLATNEVGEVHTDAWLQVIVLPEIFPGPSPVLFTQNGPAWLPCHAEGRPPPTIQWLKDGVEISGEERYRVLSNGTLYITELHASDSGVFQCVASNYGGFVTMDIELDVQVPPDIIVFDGNVTVDTGYRADLKCISIGNPRPHVTWKFEGRPVDLTDPRFTLLNNGTLRIHDVKKDDLGSYTCEARNSVGITSIFSWLNVKYSPQIIRPSDNTDVVVNATAWLNCVAESNPPAVITWTVHGQSLPGSSRYTQLDNGTLEIRPDEEGLYVYECRATNPLGNDTITVVVTVLAHPQIVHPPDDHDYVVIEGLTLLLDCVALGYHQPQISWSRHGRPVDLTSSRFTVFPNGTLRIDRVSEKEDDGSYTCTATNRVGEDSQQFNVDVQTRPSVEPITPRTVNAGDVVYLECVVSGNPLPSVKWYFENTPVADLGNKRISTAKGNRLKIRKIKTAEAGKYDCVATNDLGSARGSIQVTVRTHPSIKKMKDASTYRGETIYLNCPAQGNPRPTITWLKDGQPVVLDYRQAFFPLNGTLKLINVQTTDTGNYTCRAENVVGAVEKKMALFVRVPVIISGLIDTVATAGQDVVLRCKATGVPKPRVAWFVHPSVRSSPRLQQMPDGSLRLRNAERSDSGMFTCRASNSPNDSPKDNDEKSAILTVVVPPTIGPVQDVTVMQGDVAVLPCPAQGTQPIRYTWIKHTSNRLPLGGRHGISQATGSLTITDAQASDAGSYECQAQNQVATARQSVRLFVQTLPHITPPRNDLLFPTPSAGQSIVLHCQVGGSPQPDVIWTKDGVNIEGGQRFVIGRDNSLTIRNLRSDDAGRYVCTAVNAVGNATLNYTLTVLFSPVIVTGPQSQTVTSGETVTFLCVVYAQPQATIVWRKDRLALSSVGVTTYPSGRLVIHSAKKADAGSYTCTASNTLGLATSQAASLIVRYPPTITVPPGNQSVLHGAPVSLRCLASEGLPTPSISWTCHGRPVPLNSEGYWLQTNVLQIPSAVEKNEGWCCCIALNQVGNDTRCAYITVTSLPRVTVHDFRPVAIVGRDALINVEVIGDGKMTTYWTHNGVQLGGSSRHQQLLNNSLLIRNIKFSDAGRYQLTAANEFGSTRIDVELTVYEPPHVRNMRNRSVLVGSSIQMQCIANGRPSPTIAWYRHGRRITTGGRFLVAWLGILQISRTDTADAGEYTCTARNVAGVHSGSVHLSVLVPPSIVDSTRSLPPFRPGDTLEIPCVVSGNPKPLVTWTKNGIPISALGNSRVYVDQDNTLVIRQVQSSDSGSYMCSARSSVGTASRTVTFSSGDPVTVTSPIPPVAISFPTIIRPSTSTSVLTVTCVVQGLTNYNVVWTRNGNALPSDPRYSIRSTASGSVLTISNAGPQDMGAYGCSATGTQVVGSGTQIIVGQPRISSTQTNIYSETPGRSIQLSCPVTGHPTPTITWLKNNAPLTIDGSKYIASGTTLTIRNLQSSDAGYYSCQAANIHGTATHTVVVLVTAVNPPSNRRVYDVYIGATVRLSCTLSVNGVPSTNVLWRLNGIPLLSGNRIAINPSGTLTITGVTLSDQGIYTCYDDRLGAALSLDSELRVQSQPWQQGGSWQVRPEDGGWRVGPAPLDNPNSVPVNAGGNVLLPCQLPPVITWYKDGRSILLDNRISLLSNGYLRINRLKLSDSGSYECRSSSRTSEKHTVVLDVKAIANVQPTEPVQPATAAVTEQATVVVTEGATREMVATVTRQVVAAVGEALSLDCAAGDFSTVRITWMKDGRPVDVGGGRRFNQFNNGTLSVNSVQLSDEGNYTCIADDHKTVIIGVTVADVNNCDSSPCDHLCEDLIGSYRCTCFSGYLMKGQNKCEDLDECVLTQPCDYECENLEGSFKCTCPSGYRKGEDGTSCININECEETDTECADRCLDTYGSYQCIRQVCPEHYEMIREGVCWKNCSPSEVPCPATVILNAMALKHRHPQDTPILNIIPMDRQGQQSKAKNTYHRFAKIGDSKIFAVRDRNGNSTVVIIGLLEQGSRELQTLIYTFDDEGRLDTVTVYITLLFVSEYPF